ncbi:MAG: threonine/serine dehydratase [Robiginitomaculum sp.]|nr:threonine/serine dehydratase [Robiginitomaculum sp.]MDQ7078284.1 threonine/serine dehydratase [Robiginitomaculum sp.]
MLQNNTLPDFADVEAAHARLKGRVVRTPLLRCAALDAVVGRSVFVKAECLQTTGSFKYRGASNRIMQLAEHERAAGVVAYSSGNHAQGVAAAAAEAGVPALIVMPRDVPAVKSDGVKARSAQIVYYDRIHENREEMAARIAKERGAVLVPPYEDPMVIAGQGTAGMECAEQLREFGVAPEALIVNAGGGGLTAGIALAWEALNPEAKLYTAEPDGFDDHKRSFAVGKKQRNDRLDGSVCDALLTPEPGDLTFGINQSRITAGLSASDEDVFAAMRFAFRHLKITLEPGGAMALAITLKGLVPGKGPLCVLATGGNVDPVLFARVITA